MSTFDLNIHHYTLDDILQLFKLTTIDSISIKDIQRCKQQVLQMHPDKSKLPSEFFLFYKKALDAILEVFQNQMKLNQPVKPQSYVQNHVGNEDEYLKQKLSSLPSETFEKIFHQSFESIAPKRNQRDNTWFQDHSSHMSHRVNNVRDLHQTIDSLKHQQKQQQLSLYRDFQEIKTTEATSFYEEDEDSYIHTDVFSKLKFDDIRRVHKDETVFLISEKDFDGNPRYQSAQQLDLIRKSSQYSFAPNPEEMLRQKQKTMEQITARKAFQSHQQTLEFEEAQKQVLAKLLLLE